MSEYVAKGEIKAGSRVSIIKIPTKYKDNFDRSGLEVGSKGMVRELTRRGRVDFAMVDFRKSEVLRYGFYTYIPLSCLSLG